MSAPTTRTSRRSTPAARGLVVAQPDRPSRPTGAPSSRSTPGSKRTASSGSPASTPAGSPASCATRGAQNGVIAYQPDGRARPRRDAARRRRPGPAWTAWTWRGGHLPAELRVDETAWQRGEGYGTQERAAVSRRRVRLRRQAQHPAHARRARLPGHRGAGRPPPPRRSCATSPTASSCPTARATRPRPATTRCR